MKKSKKIGKQRLIITSVVLAIIITTSILLYFFVFNNNQTRENTTETIYKGTTGTFYAELCASGQVATVIEENSSGDVINYECGEKPPCSDDGAHYLTYNSGGYLVCRNNNIQALKPILYLYPTTKTEVTVSFTRPELLLTTYPKFNNTWRVTAEPNGDLIDVDGKKYYALYWDAINPAPDTFADGWYVDATNALTFLEDKLAQIGLNWRERNEFIMYWLPKLEQNSQSLVRFKLTEQLQNENAVQISPQPDTFLRVEIQIKKVDEKINLPEQQLPATFERRGFTAVEWGGSEY
jgi:hypothetical protein